MTEDERDIMNRLHAEGERRSNDFGHQTIVDKTKGSPVPTSIYSPRAEPVKKRPAEPVGSANPRRSDLESRRSSPPPPVAPRWVRCKD